MTPSFQIQRGPETANRERGHGRSTLMVFLFVLLPACRPSITSDDIEGGCRLNRDCPAGQVCTPAFLCNADVAVGVDEFAGNFSFAVDDQGARDCNLYAKSNIGGKEVVYFSTCDLAVTSDQKRMTFGFNSISPKEEHEILFGFPVGLVVPQRTIVLRDGLEDVTDPYGTGTIVRFGPKGEKLIQAEVLSGSFQFLQVAAKAGESFKGNFRGQLHRPTFFQTAIAAKCTAPMVVEPIDQSCVTPFAGWSLMAGLDAVYQGKGTFNEGFMLATARIDGTEHRYRGGGSFALPQSSNILLSGMFSSSDESKLYELELLLAKNQVATGANITLGSAATGSLYLLDNKGNRQTKVALLASGGLSITYFKDGSFGRLFAVVKGNLEAARDLREGEDCTPASDRCTPPLVCKPVDSASQGWCFPICSGPANCTSPRECAQFADFNDKVFSMCVHRNADFLACHPRSMEYCAATSTCVSVSSAQNLSVCLPDCNTSSPACASDQRCVASASPPKGYCYKIIPNHSDCSQSRTSEGKLCSLNSLCLTTDNVSVCLTKCTPSSGSGCASSERCLTTSNPSVGACYGTIARGSACSPDQFRAGFTCTSSDLCVLSTSISGYCRQDCTANHSSCSAYSCKQLQNGSWACTP